MARRFLELSEKGFELVAWFCEEDLIGCDFYIVQHTDVSVLSHCASGGAFAAVSSAFVSRGGVVFGAVYDDDMKVAHVSADSIEGVLPMSSSKYVQSDLGDCFKKVEAFLKAGKDVLFSGCPCQVAGLKSFLKVRRLDKSELDKLYCIDFVCHGVGSPRVLESYVGEYRNAGFDIDSMNMRSKHFGYRNSSMHLVAKNGKERYVSTRADRFLGAFFSNCISRPSCHACAFKGIQRPSDLTLWDSWNAEAVLDKKFDNSGYTNVISRGMHGRELLSLADGSLTIYEVAFSDIAPRNGGMLANSCAKSPARDRFLALVAEKGIETAATELLPFKLRDRFREFVKGVFWRLGLLDFASRIKRAMR